MVENFHENLGRPICYFPLSMILFVSREFWKNTSIHFPGNYTRRWHCSKQWNSSLNSKINIGNGSQQGWRKKKGIENSGGEIYRCFKQTAYDILSVWKTIICLHSHFFRYIVNIFLYNLYLVYARWSRG